MDKMRTISVGKTESGLLVVYQEKIESNTGSASSAKSEILDPQTFIGKSEHEVVAAIKERKKQFRIVERDGKTYEITTAYFPFRWNLYVNNGIVSNIRMF